MKKRLILLVIIFIFTLLVLRVTSATGQCRSWVWPADSLLAKEQLVLFQDAVKAKEFKSATKPLNWLLTHLPSPHESIYIKGASVYSSLADHEMDATLKRTYVDSLLLIYDLRMKYCDDKPNILSRKALSSFKYNINGPNPEQVLPLMAEAFDLAGNDIMDAILVPYMETIVVTQYKSKSLSEEQILARFDLLLSIMGMEKMDFIWYLKKMSFLALIGYLGGAVVYLIVHAVNE